MPKPTLITQNGTRIDGGDNSSHDSGGTGSEPPYMELIERVSRLETGMESLRTDMAVIKSNYATREDMHKEFNVQTWRIIGAILAAAGIVFAAARLIP